jgi:hypothetical protein
MPIYGKLDVSEHLPRAPVVSALAASADEFTAEGCTVLTFTWEIDIEKGFDVTPKALHPSIPSYCQVVFRRHGEGPLGAFTTAELRVNARAGTNYLGYCIGAFTDSRGVGETLAARYGMHVRAADVRLQRMYHGVRGTVRVGDAFVFDATLERPHYISGSDVLYTPNVNLARVAGSPKLVHQEMEYTLGKAERGRAALAAFDAAAFGDARVVLRQPLPATVTETSIRYTAVRYLLDPDRPALVGTTEVLAA